MSARYCLCKNLNDVRTSASQAPEHFFDVTDILSVQLISRWRIADDVRVEGFELLLFKTLDLVIVSLEHVVMPHLDSSPTLLEGLYACIPERIEAPFAALVTGSASPVLSFVGNALGDYSTAPRGKLVAIKLIMVLQPGWLIRSDIIKQRFMSCSSVKKAVDFLASNDKTIPFQSRGEERQIDTFMDAFRCAVGGIQLKDVSDTWPEASLDQLQVELTQRMSLPWILTTASSRKHLAVVGGRHINTMAKYSESANSLNIGLIVLGPPGHWLENSHQSVYREAFLPIDMTIDDDLPQRIVDALALHGASVDGITTFTDWLLVSTARAAEILGLPSAPVDAFRRSTDKHSTRVMAINEGQQVFRVHSMDELEENLFDLRYPLVVKPCRGWGSHGVLKVNSEKELRDAMQLLAEWSDPHDIVVETYIDGPEVDANFVLVHGQVLFFELIDDTPSSADVPSEHGTIVNSGSNFLETNQLCPSALPPSEHQLIRDVLYQQLISLGYSNGVFHVEARVINSSMVYTSPTKLDLRPLPSPRDASARKPPSVFLIEINARAPGMSELWATLFSVGIDYSALHLLCALPLSCPSTLERLKVLSTPFHTALCNKLHSNVVYIPTPHGGVFLSDDMFNDLGNRRPDLMEKVVFSICCFKNGMRVPDSSEGRYEWAGYCIVVAEDREEAVRLGQEIRGEVRVVIECDPGTRQDI
jgi:hypothetical protein